MCYNNQKSSTTATAPPRDTGFYYLQSRYYDPTIGRFINADSFASTGDGFLGYNMFAYCNNNPCNFCDPNGHMIQGRSEYGPNAMAYKGGGKVIIPLPYTKYQKNDGMINGQGVFEFADSSFLFGTYADNGCGAIALYNAMQLLGSPQSLGHVEDELFLNGSFFMGGYWGVEPWSINDYFHSHGFSCIGYSSYEKLSENVKEGAIIVFLVKNDKDNLLKGYHYMAAQYVGGTYYVYNAYCNENETMQASSLDPIYLNSEWCCGWIIGG